MVGNDRPLKEFIYIYTAHTDSLPVSLPLCQTCVTSPECIVPSGYLLTLASQVLQIYLMLLFTHVCYIVIKLCIFSFFVHFSRIVIRIPKKNNGTDYDQSSLDVLIFCNQGVCTIYWVQVKEHLGIDLAFVLMVRRRVKCGLFMPVDYNYYMTFDEGTVSSLSLPCLFYLIKYS